MFILAILLLGLALGSAARLLVPGRKPFSLAETTIVGMVGAALGATGWNLALGDGGFDRLSVGSGLAALAASVAILAILTWVADRFAWRRQPAPTVAELIEGGESSTVEHKSTARWNSHTHKRDDALEMVIAKTVAGFLNAEGGTLIIGVDDDGRPVGLDGDLSLMKTPDTDRYELWLMDHLERTLGKPALAFVSLSFDQYEGHDVAVVHIKPSDRPVFVDEPAQGRTADFYVRMGNSTRRLLTDEFADYQRSRWT